MKTVEMVKWRIPAATCEFEVIRCTKAREDCDWSDQIEMIALRLGLPEPKWERITGYVLLIGPCRRLAEQRLRECGFSSDAAIAAIAALSVGFDAVTEGLLRVSPLVRWLEELRAAMDTLQEAQEEPAEVWRAVEFLVLVKVWAIDHDFSLPLEKSGLRDERLSSRPSEVFCSGSEREHYELAL